LKGELLEAKWSKTIHAVSLPLLVSSVVLRESSCGQVDVACLKQGSIYCYEVKTSGHISRNQLLRLSRSCDWLGLIMNRMSFFRILD